MQQPAPLRTVLKLGGVSVTPATHVLVCEDAPAGGSRAAAERLAALLEQLTPGHRLQVLNESVYLRARQQHSQSSNDGAACRIPIVVGRCEALAQALQFEAAPPAASTSTTVVASWNVLTHTYESRTFVPGSGLVTTQELAIVLHPHAAIAASDANDEANARGTLAAVLWFAKEVLACDITVDNTTPSHSSAHTEPRALSPLPNAQLNIHRLNVSYSIPSSVAADTDLVQFTKDLPLLCNAENSEFEMGLAESAKPAASSSAPSAAAASSESAASYTPSPSPPAPLSALAPHEPLIVAKHTFLQPIPHGAPVRGKPVIAVDIDEVLGEFVPQLIKFHNEKYGTSFTISDIHSYHFADVQGFGTNDEVQTKISEFFQSKYFENIPTIDGAFEVLTVLRERFDLIVVTSRQHAIERVTREWLDRHYQNLFSAVLFGNHYGLAQSGLVRSKPEMCQHINAVALIDDSLTYARQCAAVCQKVVLFDRDGEYAWNVNTGEKLPLNVTRCRSWQAIRDEFEFWQPVDVVMKPDAEPE